MSPSSPVNNTSRSSTNSTRDLISQGFQRVADLLDQMNTSTCDDKIDALKQILELNSDFPSGQIKSLLQLTLSCETESELDVF